MTQITVTVLGCGSSSGTPVIGCDCPTCTSTDPKNRRTRCSAHVQIGEQYWQIDTGTDFYHQALQHKLQRIDGVLYTHPHADHLNGIDDLRAFCYKQRAAILDWLAKWLLDLSLAQQNMQPMYYPIWSKALNEISRQADTLLLFALIDKVNKLAPYGKHTLNVKMQLEDLLIEYLNIWQQKNIKS